MGARYKATGCFRFFVVLVILIPLTIMIASYVRGEDGLSNLKNIFKVETLRSLFSQHAKQSDTRPADDASSTTIEDYKTQVEALETENEQLKKENERLKKELEELRPGGQ